MQMMDINSGEPVIENGESNDDLPNKTTLAIFDIAVKSLPQNSAYAISYDFRTYGNFYRGVKFDNIFSADIIHNSTAQHSTSFL